MRKSMKKDIYINGHYIETAKNLEEAERIVERWKRQDRYEVETLGYADVKPVYEIR